MSVSFEKTGIVRASGEIGENLVIDSANKTVSHLTSGNEYIAINLGQSYMDIPSNTQVTISFDLEMKIGQVNNYFLIYNTNNKGPKQISGVQAASQIYSDVEVGDIVKKRIYVVTNIVDRDSPTTTNNYIEFYSQYNTGNVFKISNIKIEVGNKPTPWCPNKNDDIYAGDANGFIESGDMMSIYPGLIQTTEFIEW